MTPDDTPDGRSKPKLTTREKADRAAQMAAAHARGVSWPTIAREHEVSVRQAHRIVDSWEKSAPPVTTGDEVVQAEIRLLTQAIEDYALIVTSEQHAGYRIAALKNLVDTSLTRLNIMRSAGLAPRSLAAPSIAAELQTVFREFAELLRRHDVPEDVLRDFLELAEARMGGRPAAGPDRQIPAPA